MAGGAGDSYNSMLEKLQLPHPLIQRFAVSSIFQRLKTGPPHTGFQSAVGQEALTRCLESTQPAVIDQTVKEICGACAEGLVRVEKGLQDLQAALDAASSQASSSFMNGIGFLCRLFLQNVEPGSVFVTKAGDLAGVGFHPLIKSFQSKQEVRQAILQQVGSFLRTSSSSQSQRIALQFLHPFITFVFMQPMTSPSNVLFARELHSKLSVHSCNPFNEPLFGQLINYIHLYAMDSAEGRQFAIVAANDLVDIWESLLSQGDGQRGKEKPLKELGFKLFFTLVGMCHEVLSYGSSIHSSLTGVKRMIELLKSQNQRPSSSMILATVSLAHMLAMVDLEQDQLLLLDLGACWMNDIHVQQCSGSVPMPSGHFVLCWVFPTLHVMSYPSLAIKGAAATLLRTIESLALDDMLWSIPRICDDLIDCGRQHLAFVLYRLVSQMYSKEDNPSNFFKCLTASTMTAGTSSEHWLKSIIQLLTRGNESARFSNSPPTRLELSKGLLVSACTLLTMCLMDPLLSTTHLAAEAVATIAKVEPIWAMSLLPVVLFCFRYQARRGGFPASQTQLGILKVLPSLARHNSTLPLVLQVLQPMLDTKCDVISRATAVRLLCKSWEVNDRAFLHLQKMLGPDNFKGKTELHQSRAACIRDVSQKDPDRGVDLVLSVQACIESEDPVVVSLGLQSLARLCEEDVIDFYTAWLVISERFNTLPSDPHVLQSLCMFLGYGNLDAAAFPDAAATILNILWNAAKINKVVRNCDIYSTVRAASFKAISSYEVDILDVSFPSIRDEAVELLFSEGSSVALHNLEMLLIRTLTHDHKERQRGQKEIKMAIGKSEKLLKVFPRALNANEFSRTSGKVVTPVSDFPGAGLLCFNLPILEKTEKISSREYLKSMKTWQINQENIFLEAADQLNVGGNLAVAVISLQSWTSFISRWLHTVARFYETESPQLGQDERLLRAAKYLLKIIQRSCEDGVPRVAENSTLALAALCKVTPVHAHGICEEVFEFLESRLLQEGHEHMQWSATLALGVVATCLHTTDWSLKTKIVQLLVEYASTSDRGVVRGACGIAMGVLCQSLLQQGSTSQLTGAIRQREAESLVQICITLMQLTSETCPNAASALAKLSGQLRTEVIEKERISVSPFRSTGSKLEEDSFWATVGLVWGLGSTITGLSRLQCPQLLSTLADLMISWVSLSFEGEQVDTPQQFMACSNANLFLAAGACLALPTCLEVCAKLELLSVAVNTLLQRVESVVRLVTDRAQSVRMSDWWPSLLCLFYLGSGNMLGTVLQDGGQSINIELIRTLLASLQIGVELQDRGGMANFGASFGIANTLGANAAILGPSARNSQVSELRMTSGMQVRDADESLVSRPLLYEATEDDYVAGIIRGLIEAVRVEQLSHLRIYAAWALAFIHEAYFNTVGLAAGNDSLEGESGKEPRQPGYHMRNLQDLPERSVLRTLCTRLTSQKHLEKAATLLRCLQGAPRLPALDWGGIIRRIWRQPQLSPESNNELHHLQVEHLGLSEVKSSLMEVREQCMLFAVAHADKVPALASFIDELCELARMGTLESSLRNLLVGQFSDLKRIFSPRRLEQLFSDVQELAMNLVGFSGSIFENKNRADSEAIEFRVSIWNGLSPFLEDSSDGLGGDVNDQRHQLVEECMLTLVNLLSTCVIWRRKSSEDEKKNVEDTAREWTAAVATLTKAKRPWLLQALEVSSTEASQPQKDLDRLSKIILARCQLVGTQCLYISDLISCRNWLLNRGPSDVAELLVEVAWATKEAALEDRQGWLQDTVDTAFISPFPQTAILLTSLLATCWCSYAPLLPMKPLSALEDLPFTIPSVLEQDGWGHTRERILKTFPALLNKLGNKPTPGNQVWENIEFSTGTLSLARLLSILQRSCVALRHYLPVESRIELAQSRFYMTQAEYVML